MRKIPFFQHQLTRTVSIDNATEGDYPNVRVLIFDGEGALHQEDVPIKFIGEEQASSVVIETGNKNGYIIIG